MKTILVPTDGSEAADKALDLAFDLARQHDATIKLLHVLLRDMEPEDLLRLPDVDTAGDDVLNDLQRAAASPGKTLSASQLMSSAVTKPTPEPVLRQLGEQVLMRARKRADAQGVRVEALGLADGAPAPEIVASAVAASADMIVMGTRGLRQIEAFTFGSVSQEVCRLASCTCVAVH